ncbi:sodium/glutamate symporter, partial [Staphylococcus pettenkoferi]|uniref:sodium/glutamate symporter n=1 Tax=Staphylococcus pettenkoferi TaxID=170573 RepID=UPI001C92C10D
VLKFLINPYNFKPKHPQHTTKHYTQLHYNHKLHAKISTTNLFFLQFSVVAVCIAIASYLPHLFTNYTPHTLPLYLPSIIIPL